MHPDDSSNETSLSSLLLLRGHSHSHGAHKAGNAVIGIALTVLSTLVLAGRLVAEEFALTGTSLHPLQVLGYEGMWGTILVGISLPIVWVIPGSDIGRYPFYLGWADFQSQHSQQAKLDCHNFRYIKEPASDIACSQGNYEPGHVASR